MGEGFLQEEINCLVYINV